MSLELQGKGRNELRVGAKWIERCVVGTGLKISDSGLERREFFHAHCLGWVAAARRVFDARRQTRLEGEVDGAVGVASREPAHSDLDGSHLSTLNNGKGLRTARLGYPRLGRIKIDPSLPQSGSNSAALGGRTSCLNNASR